ncbi:MAG: hypothetical protein HN348_24890 [Proteobacteria bacterium]|jgi:hypothetical protein|nr:hypothetical protein [Pseudomonadota bacterium]
MSLYYHMYVTAQQTNRVVEDHHGMSLVLHSQGFAAALANVIISVAVGAIFAGSGIALAIAGSWPIALAAFVLSIMFLMVLMTEMDKLTWGMPRRLVCTSDRLLVESTWLGRTQFDVLLSDIIRVGVTMRGTLTGVEVLAHSGRWFVPVSGDSPYTVEFLVDTINEAIHFNTLNNVPREVPQELQKLIKRERV